MVEHGQPHSQQWSNMVYNINNPIVSHTQPWSTMVEHGQPHKNGQPHVQTLLTTFSTTWSAMDNYGQTRTTAWST